MNEVEVRSLLQQMQDDYGIESGEINAILAAMRMAPLGSKWFAWVTVRFKLGSENEPDLSEMEQEVRRWVSEVLDQAKGDDELDPFTIPDAEDFTVGVSQILQGDSLRS